MRMSTHTNNWHTALATAWAQYNSRSGKATPAQVDRIMRQLRVVELERMLADRHFDIHQMAQACIAAGVQS